MSVETTTRKVTQTMDEAITEYTFTFRALAGSPSDIKCIRETIATGALEDMTYMADLPDDPGEADALKYTVEINDDGIGGTITVAYAAAGFNDDTFKITIYRDTTDTQGSVYDDYNQFPAKTVESDFDRRTLIDQEQTEDMLRAIRVPINVDADLVNLRLPAPSASKIIGWNSDGDAMENKDAIDASYLTQVETARDTANTYSTIADSHATTALTYSTIASSHATTAQEAADSLEVVDNLTSTSSTQALSANQGKVLKADVDGKISKTTAGEIAAMTEKTTPVDNDLILIEDSAASNAKKKVKKSNLSSNIVIGVGTEPHGDTIPFPSLSGGHSSGDYDWYIQVSINNIGSYTGGDGDDLQGINCSVNQSTRVVTCYGKQNNNGTVNGTANYMIIGTLK